jgi:2-dehydro-3-deoxy-D-arabinonate dehydratase
MKLYKTTAGPVAEADGRFYSLPPVNWDELVNHDALRAVLVDAVRTSGRLLDESAFKQRVILPPIGSQEVWAAGVTYLRSKVARMEESKAAGGGDFYDKVYDAARPELFFKSMPHKVVGPGQPVRIRRDSKWNVPEPELALFVNSLGVISAYTIGNDMSSRDIEGENPLYLPQAKVYDGSCALGPCLLVMTDPLPRTTSIAIKIVRSGKPGQGGQGGFEGQTSLAQMKRELPELVEYLYRDHSFPTGAILLTGTGVVPPDSFTLRQGDEISMTIEGIGTLTNTVA